MKDMKWLKEEVLNQNLINKDGYIYAGNLTRLLDQLDEPEELEKILAYEPHDPIKPKHYRKGEIDLYESAYRTRPFNEFRAIMEFIAERYMKRDKDNRIQDLDKATYTLSRLKEYEEMESSKKC